MVVVRAKVFFGLLFLPHPHDFRQGSNKSGIRGSVVLVSRRMPVVCTKIIVAKATSGSTKMLLLKREDADRSSRAQTRKREKL